MQAVQLGDQLPSVDVDVSATLIISAAIASRDFAEIHHDRDAARTRGLKDIIMNIETTTGIVCRYITDWAGPNTVLRHLNLRLGVPNYPHDTMRLSGTITALHQREDPQVTEVQVRGVNSLGEHTLATVLATFPRDREVDAPPSAPELAQDALRIPPIDKAREEIGEMPGLVRELIGVESEVVQAPEIVSGVVIRQFVDAIDDSNPAYVDRAFAQRSVHGDLVAPPGMLQAWTLKARRGPDLFANAPSFEVGERLRAEGATSMIATNCEQDYIRYLRPGESLRLRSAVTRVIGPKRTSLGLGYFVTTRISVLDESGEIVGWHQGTTLRYSPNSPAHK